MTSLKSLPGGLEKISLVQIFGDYLKSQSDENKTKGLGFLMALASDEPEWWTRLVAIQALESYSDRPEVKSFFASRGELEEHPQLKEYIQGL